MIFVCTANCHQTAYWIYSHTEQQQTCQSSNIIFKLSGKLHDFNCCHSFIPIILHLLHRVFLSLFEKATWHRLTFFMLFWKSASVSLYNVRTQTCNFPFNWPALLACKTQKKAVSTVSFHLFFCCAVFKWYCSLNILKISGSFEATTWVPISFQN